MGGTGCTPIESLDIGFEDYVAAMAKGLKEAPGADLLQWFAACHACSRT